MFREGRGQVWYDYSYLYIYLFTGCNSDILDLNSSKTWVITPSFFKLFFFHAQNGALPCCVLHFTILICFLIAQVAELLQYHISVHLHLHNALHHMLRMSHLNVESCLHLQSSFNDQVHKQGKYEESCHNLNMRLSSYNRPIFSWRPRWCWAIIDMEEHSNK